MHALTLTKHVNAKQEMLDSQHILSVPTIHLLAPEIHR